MRLRIQLAFCFVILATIAVPVCGQETVASPQPVSPSANTVTSPVGNEDEVEKEIEWPSPDGRFAFLKAYGQDLHKIDLIDKKSEKALLHVGEEDSSMVYWHVLWAPDSKRFALMTRYGHPFQEITVYFRSGETFRKIELPKLPMANIPARLKRGKKFPHIANQNWQEGAWKKDGSLVVTIDSMIDGDGASLSATRTVVLGFDRSGKARVLKSTIEYEAKDD